MRNMSKMDKPQTTNLMTDSSDKEKTRKLNYNEYISRVAWSNTRKDALERDTLSENPPQHQNKTCHILILF